MDYISNYITLFLKTNSDNERKKYYEILLTLIKNYNFSTIQNINKKIKDQSIDAIETYNTNPIEYNKSPVIQILQFLDSGLP